jgi:PilZ domain-containing protein
MQIQKTEVTKEQVRHQRQRCERFATGTADAIGAAGHCLFSLLPYEERVRQAAGWYDACAQAMLRGNYAPLDEWIRRQACGTAAEGFELEDLLKLLRICRRSAVEIDGWDEDVFSAVDDVINEGLLAIRPKVPWNISDGLNYLKEAESIPALKAELNASEPTACAETRQGERREFGRNRLALPIRVRCTAKHGQGEEVTFTQSVSLSGLYFRTQKNYPIGSPLLVTYPYWTGPGSINREYSARVARLDPMPDRSWGVAVEFLQNLRHKTA